MQVLAAHDLFTQLNGTPYSIKTIAAFYKNPNVAHNDLLGIYERLISIDEDSEKGNLRSVDDENSLAQK